MSELKKINQVTPEEIKAKGVSALATHPNRVSQYGKSGLSAAELKAHFDALGVLVAGRLNELLRALSSSDATEYVALPSGYHEDYTTLKDVISALVSGGAAEDIIKLYPDEARQTKKEGLEALQKIINGFAKGISDNAGMVLNGVKLLVADKKIQFGFKNGESITMDVATLLNPTWNTKVDYSNIPPTSMAVKLFVDEECGKRVGKESPDYADGSTANVYGIDPGGNTIVVKGASQATPNTIVHRDSEGYFDVAHPIGLEHPVSKMHFDNKHNNSLYEDVNRLNVALAELEAAVNGDKYTPVTIDSEFVATRIDKAMPYGVLSYLRQVPQSVYPDGVSELILSRTIANISDSSTEKLFELCQTFLNGGYMYLKTPPAYYSKVKDTPCYLLFTGKDMDENGVGTQYRVSLTYNTANRYNKVVIEERHTVNKPNWERSDLSSHAVYANSRLVEYKGLPVYIAVETSSMALPNAPYTAKILVGYAFDITNVTNSSDKIISNVNGVITMPKGSLYYAKIPCEILPDTSVDVYFKTSVDDSRDKINSVRLLTGTKTQITAVNDFSSTPVSLVNTKMAAYIAFYKKEPSKESYGAMQVTDVDVKFADANYSNVVRVTHEITIPTSVTSREGYGNPDSYIDFVNRRFFDATANEMVDLSAVLPEDISTLPLSNGVTITFLDAEGNQTIAHPTINYIVDNTEV